MVNGQTQQRKRRQLKRSQKAIRKGTMNINTVLDPSSNVESF